MGNQQTSTRHLDKTVIILFLVVFLFSMSAFTYRYINYKPCEGVIFEAKAKEMRVGELIKFTAYSDNAKIWKWEFGDSTEVLTTKEPLHIFKKPGEYNVRLIVNDICESYKTIIIKEKLFVIDSSKLPKFKIPKTIKVGQTLSVRNDTETASTWEWNFGETVQANSTKSHAKYVYKESGPKTISLIVNGDVKHITKKVINVLPVEEVTSVVIEGTNRNPFGNIKKLPLDEMNNNKGGEVKPKVVPPISNSEFKNKLILVSKKMQEASDFKEYMCDDLNKPIYVNGQKQSFLDFCQKIRGKKLKIKELTLDKNKNNCINFVRIEVPKKFLGIF